jgi:UDP-3-O-[3-hydroxymyristoyl] glucosamine N-acyltransferase
MDLYSCSASLLVIAEDLPQTEKFINSRTGRGLATIVFEDPYLFLARASSYIDSINKIQTNKVDIHPSATVDKSVVLKKGVKIGAGCVLESDVLIGEFSVINSLSFIGRGSVLGSNCLLHPKSTVLSYVAIGENVILHSGAVIGSDGFGYTKNKKNTWEKIPQKGSVIIGNDVEIGANTTIDRGTFDATIVGSRSKLDNQVHIAHNVKIGKDTVIAGCVGVAGSAEIGNQCQIGGAAGILGHLKICDKTIIGPMSLVTSNISKSGKYVGIYPIQTDREWKRSSYLIKKLDSLRKKFFTVKN